MMPHFTPVQQNVLAFAVGAVIAPVLSLVARPVMNTVRLASDPAEGLTPTEQAEWQLWLKAIKNQHVPLSGRILGALAAILFFTAIWFRSDVALGGWLAFKLAAKWESWGHVVNPGLPELPFSNNPIRSLWARHQWGIELFRRFLLGTLWNLLSAGLAVAAGKLILSLISVENGFQPT